MNISIVIPNYNGESILKKNLPKVLESVKEYKLGFVEIIITDDCSSDNSKTIISNFIDSNKKKGVGIKFLTSDKNKGFSSNVNKGVKEAKGDIVILLNTDVAPSKNFLTPLVKHFDDGDVFAVGCMDESVENGKIVLRGRGTGKWEKGFLVHSAGSLDKKNTLWVAGGSGAFRKEIWDRLGGLDKIYNPFYWEDIDISYRAQKSGYKTLFEKDSVVRHEHDKGAIKREYSLKDVRKIAYRNQFIFVWKNADTSLLLSHVVWLPYHLLTGLFRDYLLIIGFLKALLIIHKVFRSRLKTQVYFKLTDRQVIQAVEV